ncbi:MAG: DUF4440 domain-containing protein [Gemmatimonadetes bacterium]|nr:DUF4440 domain-containing protein [Gemmatimonadota bacterium]
MKRLSVAVTAALALAACSDTDTVGSVQTTAPPASPLEAYAPTTQQRTEAVAALQRLFDALEAGDADLLRSVLDPSVVMHSTETRDGQTTFGSATVDALATRISTSDVRLIERMWDPVVVVSGSLATIWTPYDFYSGTTFSHCGVDSATLLHTDEGWKIVALSWTRLQPPACALHPEGPPTG